MSAEPSLELCDLIGRSGKYQITIAIVYFFVASLNGFMSVNIELYAPEVTLHWDWDGSNTTFFSSTNCKMNTILEFNFSSIISNSSSKLIYESPYSRRTLTEKFDLTCERSWLVSLSNSMLIFGSFFGFLVSSRLSEKYGRKVFILGNGAFCAVSNFCILFCQNDIMLLLSVLLYGATTPTWMIFIFLDVLEIQPKSLVPYVVCIATLGILCGQTLLAGVSWLLKDWLHTQIFQTFYTLTVLFMSVYLLDSPLWLSVRGKYKEAANTITKIIERNRGDNVAAKPKIERYLEEIKRRCEVESVAEKGKLSDLFKNRMISFYTIGTSVSRSCLMAIFYGVIMNTESFGSGMYVDLMVSAAISILSVGVTILIMEKITLRQHLIAYFVCEGIVCGTYPLIYGYPIARSVITAFARWFITCTYCVSFVYISQVFPTSVRGIGVGFVNLSTSLATCGIPFAKEMGETTALYVPFIVFSVISFIAVAFHMLLPDTKERGILHTVDELTASLKQQRFGRLRRRTSSIDVEWQQHVFNDWENVRKNAFNSEYIILKVSQLQCSTSKLL